MAHPEPRLPLVDPGKAAEPVRAALAGEPPVDVLRAIAHAETVFVPWLTYAKGLLSELQLPARRRELAMLQAARLEPHAAYEWAQHARFARATGVTDGQIRAIAEGRTRAPCFDAADRAILAVVTGVVCDGVPGESQADEFVEWFSVRELVELVLVVGHIMMLARVSATFGLTPVAQVDEAFFRTLED